MTLVTLVVSGGQPFLIGDLATSNNLGNDKLILPTRLRHDEVVPHPDFEGNKFVNLRQKICLISNKVAVGWSGNFSDAKSVVVSLRKRFNQGEDANATEVLRAIQQEYVSITSLSIIGLVQEKEGFKAFRWDRNTNDSIKEIGGTVTQDVTNVTDIPDYNLETLFTIGSGFPVWERVEEFQHPFAFGFTETNLPLSKPYKILSRFWGNELACSEPHERMAGGGYEIIGVNNGKLTKLNDFTVWAYKVKKRHSGYIPAPVMAFKNFYYRDNLSLQRLVFGPRCSLYGSYLETPYTRKTWLICDVGDVRRHSVVDARKTENNSIISSHHFHIFFLHDVGLPSWGVLCHTGGEHHPYTINLKKRYCLFEFATDSYARFLYDLETQILARKQLVQSASLSA